MALPGAITTDQITDFSTFTFAKGPRWHLILPLVFFCFALATLLGWEYYHQWKQKRRLRRHFAAKPRRSPK